MVPISNVCYKEIGGFQRTVKGSTIHSHRGRVHANHRGSEGPPADHRDLCASQGVRVP